MNTKKVLPLVISLVVAIAVLGIALKLINKPKTGSSGSKSMKVVIAKADIDAGGVINEEQLSLTEVAADAVPSDGVFRTPTELNGRVTTVPLIAGQIVTANVLVPKGTGPGLQAVVPSNQRAITIDINEVTGVAGNVMQGSHIDIIQTLKDDSNNGSSMARTIAQNVIVAGIGMHRTGPDSAPDGGGRSVTLLVTPAQAQLIELACMNGRPRLTLRGSNDLTVKDLPPVTLTELVRPSKKTDPFSIFLTSLFTPKATPPVKDAVAPTGAKTVAPVAIAPTTRPTPDDKWTVLMVRGTANSVETFQLHDARGEVITDTNDPIDNKIPIGSH